MGSGQDRLIRCSFQSKSPKPSARTASQSGTDHPLHADSAAGFRSRRARGPIPISAIAVMSAELIEKVSGKPYGKYVQEEVLAPLGVPTACGSGIRYFATCGALVMYYNKGTGPSVFPPNVGKQVPLPYGAGISKPWTRLRRMDRVGNGSRTASANRSTMTPSIRAAG